MAIASGGTMGIRGSGNQAESLDEGGWSLFLHRLRLYLIDLQAVISTQCLVKR